MRPLVTVEDKSISDLYLLLGLLQGLRYQSNRIGLVKDMRHDEAIVEILDRGQISPALQGANVGDICDPLLVWFCRDKVPIEYIGIAMVRPDFFQFFVHFGLSGLRTDTQLAHTCTCVLVQVLAAKQPCG